jgi:hypothetical protein
VASHGHSFGPRWLWLTIGFGLGTLDVCLFVLDHLQRLDYLRQHHRRMYELLIDPQIMLIIAFGAMALSFVGFMRDRAEKAGAENTSRRTGSITPLSVQFWQVCQNENLGYRGNGHT